MSGSGAYDVFVSYSRRDREAVHFVARALENHGLSVFLDEWYLVAGAAWQATLEREIGASRSVAVFVGPGSMGAWQKREVELALDRQSKDDTFLVVPVLLPRAEPPLGFLRLFTWVSLETGVDDPVTIEVLARSIRGEPPSADLILTPKGICPYRGLRPFRTEDASFFFGRETFTERLHERVQACSLVMVAGASGAGKSSLVLAGLIPTLQHDDAQHRWEIAVLRPGDRPLYQLATALLPVWQPARSELNPAVADFDRLQEVGRLAAGFGDGSISLRDLVEDCLRGQPDTTRLLLVVDQWEELYTLCRDEPQRRGFVDLILEATSLARVTAVLTLRGDFYRHVLDDRALADRLQGGVVNLSPMTRAELERSINAPAELVRLRFEAGLVDRVLDDVEEGPGTLPLLAFVLEQLWQQRRGDVLTHAAYEAMGELQGAISTRAQAEMHQLTHAERDRLRAAFLQMVRPGETTEDTRRRATRVEIGELAWPIVQRFVDARLLVAGYDAATGQEEVEVSHEALIRNWQQLRTWLDEDREFLLWRERLRRALMEWERTQCDDGGLLRGARLGEARRRLVERTAELTDREREYIEQSWRAQRRRTRQRRGLIAATAAVIALAGLGAGEAVLDRNRVRTTAALLNAAQASRDPLLQALLTAELPGTREPADGVSLVRSFANQRIPRLAFRGEWGAVRDYAWSSDGALVAAGFADGRARVWRSDGTGATKVLRHEDEVTTVSFSPDGGRLVTGTEGGQVRVWNVESGTVVTELPSHDASVWQTSFTPDGTHVLTLAADAARLGPADGSGAPIVFSHDGSYATAVALSGDGSRVAVGFGNGSVHVWPVTGGAAIEMRGRHRGTVLGVAFDPAGQRVVSASRDSTARVWNGDGGALETLSGHAGAVWSAAFDPSGERVVTASDDGTARIWELGRAGEFGSEFSELAGHRARVWSASFSPEGARVVTASDDGTARLYSTERPDPGEPLLGHDGAVIGAAFSPAGNSLITASADGSVRLWTTDAGDPIVLRGGRVAAFAAGDRLVTGSADGAVSLWPRAGGDAEPVGQQQSLIVSLDAVADRRLALTLDASGEAVLWALDGSRRRTPLSGHTGPIRNARLSDDGARAITVSFDSTVRVWDSTTGAALGPPMRHSEGVEAAALGDQGRRVASGSIDGTVRLWNAARDGMTVLARIPAAVEKIAYSADGRHVLAAAGQAWLWNVAEPGAAIILDEHGTNVNNVVFDPTSRLLATAASDGTVYIQNADGSGNMITLTGHTGRVALTFNRDGQRLLTASSDGTARIWRTDGAGAPIVLTGHTADVISARFSPDEKHVLTASEDGTVRIWSIDWHTLIRGLNGSTNACLTVNDRIRYLGQRPDAAGKAFARCERQHGRSPPLPAATNNAVP